MDSMENHHLWWWKEPSSTFNKNIELNHAVDSNTLDLWRIMGKSLQEYIKKDHTLFPAHDVKPYLVSMWNVLKGGQDVVSRQLKEVKIDFRCLSPRAFVFIRQMMTMMLNSHLVLRLIMMKRRKKLDNMTKYRRIKEDLNKLGSFSSFLWKFAENWDGEKKIKSAVHAGAMEEEEIAGIRRSEIPRRNRIDYFNTIDGRQLRKSSAGHILLHCQKPKKRCVLCEMKTTCKCSKCTVFLCRFTHSNNRTTCWERFHERHIISKIIRGKQKTTSNSEIYTIPEESTAASAPSRKRKRGEKSPRHITSPTESNTAERRYPKRVRK
jgi:hypothetical protein